MQLPHAAAFASVISPSFPHHAALSSSPYASSSGGAQTPGVPAQPANPYLLSPSAVFSTNLSAVASLSLASLSPSELVFKARLALQAERFDEMAYFMRVCVLQKPTPLSSEERALFSLAYKKLLSSRRMGWRYIYSIEMKEKAQARKLEAEIAREVEREEKERAKEKAQAKKLEGDLEERCKNAEGKKEGEDPPGTQPPTTEDLKDSRSKSEESKLKPAPIPSVIPALQTRLAQLTQNLGHIHSYRYQLFYESALLISESSSLLLEKLLPKLLTSQSEDVFLKFIPSIIEQLLVWERKRSTRPGGVVLGGKGKEQQQNKAAEKANDASVHATPLLTAMPVPSASIGGGGGAASTPGLPPLTKLDQSRHWSLEAEFDLQLRALDERTRFLSSLRSIHAEALVFYCKMLADQRRLLAEFLAERDYEETERENQSLQALAYYCLARFIAQPTLSPSHPVRLGLYLNFAVFSYEVLAKPDRACQMASQAYDQALNEWQMRQLAAQQSGQPGSAGATSSTGGASSTNAAGNAAAAGTDANGVNSAAAVAGTYKDSLLIMQLLKHNLTMWAQSL
jgi:hypothetical protein